MGRACTTCRTRRIWCDTSLPQCKNCINSGRQCGGYEDQKHNVFVNIDSTNISNSKKKIRGQAIRNANAHKQIATSKSKLSSEDADLFFEGHEFRRLSVCSLEFSPAEFRDHFTTLWAYFHSNYATTWDSVTVGYSQLMLQNKALDLGLIALCTQRLAITAGNARLKEMSLTAYHHSLRLFLHAMQNNNVRNSVVFFMLSFVFTLLEGAQRIPSESQEPDSLQDAHMQGALAILEKQDPDIYANEGYHEVFTKARELIFHRSMSMRQPTFLTQDKWMTRPFRKIKRNWRDKLHDVGFGMTKIAAYLGKSGALLEGEPAPVDITGRKRMAEECRTLWIDLVNWREDWLRLAHPSLLITCSGRCGELCYCSLPAEEFPDSNFAHLQAEQWSCLLNLGLLFQELHMGSSLDEPPSTSRPNIHDDLIRRLPYIAYLIDGALAQPWFGQCQKDTPGITEGRCRSLFPLWVLNQWRTRDCSMAAQIAWWSALGNRLAYGDRVYHSPYAPTNPPSLQSAETSA